MELVYRINENWVHGNGRPKCVGKVNELSDPQKRNKETRARDTKNEIFKFHSPFEVDFHVNFLGVNVSLEGFFPFKIQQGGQVLHLLRRRDLYNKIISAPFSVTTVARIPSLNARHSILRLVSDIEALDAGQSMLALGSETE